MDPAPAKICVFCNQDCSRRPRAKDSRGRYMCNDCLARRRVKADLASPIVPARPAAATAVDSEHTMVGAESPEPAAPEPTLLRPARALSDDDPIPMPSPDPAPRHHPPVRLPAPAASSDTPAEA